LFPIKKLIKTLKLLLSGASVTLILFICALGSKFEMTFRISSAKILEVMFVAGSNNNPDRLEPKFG